MPHIKNDQGGGGGNPQELLKKKSELKKEKNPTLCYKEEFPFGQNVKQLCHKWYYLGVSYRTCCLFNPAFPIMRLQAARGNLQWWGVPGGVPLLGKRGTSISGLGSGSWGKVEPGLAGFGLFCFLTWLVKGALCACRERARLSASPAITQSTSAPFDRDAKAGKILSSYRSSENRSLEDLGDFRGH